VDQVSIRAGRFVQQQSGPDGFAAFLPAPLPPRPPLELDNALRGSLERASHALGQMDALSAFISPDHLLYVYVRKEAVLSSEIEGSQSTLADLLRYEIAEVPGAPVDDVREVSRYVAALQHGVRRLREGFPVCTRLVCEIHGELMRGEGRGGHQAPGEVRRSQAWIGGSRPGNARFVPPPPHEVGPALSALERFIHDEVDRTPPLLKAGLAHAQFETIHPFLDGNGRVGRLLITLLLCADGVLREPFLYLSLYFRRHRTAFYEALQRVRTHGDWEGWMRFYLQGVETVAREGAATTRALLELFRQDAERLRAVGRGAPTALRVHDLLCRRVIVTIPFAARELGLSQPTVTAALARMQALGIVREATGGKRRRQFVYTESLRLLDDGVLH
jgi:Fic family protein